MKLRLYLGLNRGQQDRIRHFLKATVEAIRAGCDESTPISGRTLLLHFKFKRSPARWLCRRWGVVAKSDGCVID